MEQSDKFEVFHSLDGVSGFDRFRHYQGIRKMRSSIILASAAALMTTSFIIPLTPADAKHQIREWRGKDGRLHCRRRDGTIGLVIGGVGGALVGRAIDTRGDRAVGTVVGAGAGALIGREVARKRSCR
jgi:hypothetical protein